MKKLLAAMIFVFIISGCTTNPIPSVNLDKTVISTDKPNITIGIVSTPYPKIGTSVPGAGCLLCFAVAKGIVSGITKHVKTLDADVDTLTTLMLNKVESQGLDVKLISDEFDLSTLESIKANENTPRLARYDFKSLAAKHNISHLMVLDIKSHGIVRNFSNYVPVSPPYAAVYGSAYLVDLNSNEYVWFKYIEKTLNTNGEWNSPPSFPELTNAYYSVMESTKDELQEVFAFEDVK
jgi:hypothetical protein